MCLLTNISCAQRTISFIYLCNLKNANSSFLFEQLDFLVVSINLLDLLLSLIERKSHFVFVSAPLQKPWNLLSDPLTSENHDIMNWMKQWEKFKKKPQEKSKLNFILQCTKIDYFKWRQCTNIDHFKCWTISFLGQN